MSQLNELCDEERGEKMRVRRSISPTKEPGMGTGWAELQRRVRGSAGRLRELWSRRLREAWSRRLRERRWWARTFLAVGAILALVALGGVGYRAQAHRALARAVQRWSGRGPYAAFVGPDRSLGKLGLRPRYALPSLYLDLAPPAYRALSLQRLTALRFGILWPRVAEPVEAVLRIETDSAPLRRALEGRSPAQVGASVRLAGSRCDGVHPLDQWQASKWSLVVQTAPDVMAPGVNAFALRSPALRDHLDGWLYREALYGAGLLPAQPRLVNLVLNGEDWGSYLLEPDLAPGGEAWFESLDADPQGRLLAHADLWGLGLPGACRTGAGSTEGVRRVVAAAPRARAAYENEMRQIARREYVDELRAEYGRAFDRYRRALDDEFFSAYLEEPWDRLRERQATLSARGDAALVDGMGARPWTGGDWPALTSAETLLAPVQLPAALPSVEDVLARHPFLTRSDRPGFLSVKPGDWQVAGDLVLPKGVGLAGSGSFSLRFERGAMLVAHGPLILQGEEAAGIRLLPQDDHWAGVRVLRADPALPSIWRYVEVRGIRGVQAGTGSDPDQAGLLFVESPITLERCRVLDSYAAAAVSVLRAPFEIHESEFGAASGDLIQARAAQGTISRSAFHDALGAAVRVEQSAVEIVDVSVRRVRREAIWAGPESLVEVEGLRADRIEVGVASAGAEVRVRDARVERAAVAGFLAYAEARLDIESAILEDDSVPVLVQPGSEATFAGSPVQARAFDVAELRPPVAPPPAMRPLGVRFGPSIRLVGYELTTPERAPGETIEVILYWRTFAYLERQYTIFMHVRDETGETVAGWDMMPRYNTFPTTDWPLVERIDDVHIVPLSADLPPGEYTLALGLYEWATGVRLPAYGRSGEALPEATVILEERVTVQ